MLFLLVSNKIYILSFPEKFKYILYGGDVCVDRLFVINGFVLSISLV